MFLAPFNIIATEHAPWASTGPLVVDNTGEPVWYLPVHGKTAIDLRVQTLPRPAGGDLVRGRRPRRLRRHLRHLRPDVPPGRAGRRRERPARRPARVPDHLARHRADLDLRPGARGSHVDRRAGRRRSSSWASSRRSTSRPARCCSSGAATTTSPLTETNMPQVTTAGNVDYFHLNSIGVDLDGDLLVSARHTSTVYKVDRKTGADQVAARRQAAATSSSGPGAAFNYQHDVRRHADGTLTIFDNGAALPGAGRRAVLAADAARARHEGDDRDPRRASTCRRRDARPGRWATCSSFPAAASSSAGAPSARSPSSPPTARCASTPRSATAASPTAPSGSLGRPPDRPARGRRGRRRGRRRTTRLRELERRDRGRLLAGATRARAPAR